VRQGLSSGRWQASYNPVGVFAVVDGSAAGSKPGAFLWKPHWFSRRSP
jgi:hypothetical protein